MEITKSTSVDGAYGSFADRFPYEFFISQQLCEVRRDSGEVESNIRESIHQQSVANLSEFCATNKNIADHSHRNLAAISKVECEINKSVLENRVALMDAKSAIFEKVDRETDLIKLTLNNFERNVDHNFCKISGEIKDSKQAILNQLAADKLDEKNDEIARLRARNDRHEQDFFIGNRLSGIEALVNSIKQEQTFTSKTVQFGSGNKAGTTQTSNQA